jgi:hypothetical protein
MEPIDLRTTLDPPATEPLDALRRLLARSGEIALEGEEGDDIELNVLRDIADLAGDMVDAIAIVKAIGLPVPDESTVLMYGDPSDGFNLVGPVIPNDPELEEFTDRELRDAYWWYVPMRSLPATRRQLGLDTPDSVLVGIVDETGTAIANTGLCPKHDVPERRTQVWLSAQAQRHAAPPYAWWDVSGNDELACIDCP